VVSLNAKTVLGSPHEEISRLCEIDLDDIQGCLRNHAVLYGRAYSYFQAAKAKENQEKWEFEKLRSKTAAKLRERGVAVTASKEEAEVDPDVVDQYKRFLLAEHRTGIFYALLKGLEHRKDMLVQLSSREKKEYGNF
jgi:hypothetical protein